jgi:hypothetical protein
MMHSTTDGAPGSSMARSPELQQPSDPIISGSNSDIHRCTE